jgi:hypothetical protein
MTNEKDAARLSGTLEDFCELLGIDPAPLLDLLNRGQIECFQRVMAVGNGFARTRPQTMVFGPSRTRKASPAKPDAAVRAVLNSDLS